LPSRRGARVAFALGLLAAAATPASGKVYLSRKEALAWAFPEAERVEERSLVLSDEQARAVETLARERLPSRIVKLYTAHGAGGVQGHAFIDVHTVRTLPEAFLVVLTPQGEVRSLRVLAFYEPEEYRPPERWLEQFEGRSLEAGLKPGAIHGIAGSTLSARAVTGSVRRALALYQVIVAGRAR
jgi:Na+-translocating ferredoxin:NAD+ oxidoreductase RnfG subunit